jgi:hypothetical protein
MPAATASHAATPPTLPAGAWTGIHWTRVTTAEPVWGSPPDPMMSADPDVMDNGWRVVGWSRGYLAFRMVIETRSDQSWTKTVATSHSTDGIRWQAGGSFTLTGDGTRTSGGSMVGGIVEGPSGLLAYSTEMVTCSSPDTFAFPIAVSPDGVTWTPIRYPADSIQVLDGSSAGYLAVGTSGVFTSADGTTWRRSNLSGVEFAGLDAIEGGAAFAGGYVIAGVTHGPQVDGCGAPLTPLSPSVWRSGDAVAWARETVPGAAASTQASAAVCVVNGHVLVLNEITGDTVRSWTSEDGATWRAAAGTYRCPEFGHRHAARTARTLVYEYRDNGSTALLAIGDDLAATDLTQTGDLPAWDTLMAEPVLGPAGMIATDGAGTIWVGVPVAG